MKKLLIIMALLIVAILYSNCSKNDNETIVLLGKEDYVLSINDFIPDSLQSQINTEMGTMPRGYIPCNVEGGYIISEMILAHTNYAEINPNMEVIFKISNQHNCVAQVEFQEGTTTFTDTAYIMGNGQYFTLYFKEKKTTSYQTDMNRSVIISGEKTDEGIRNIQYTSIILDVEQSNNPFVVTFRPGWYFIYEDKDGLAENYNP